jgi:hypothetical protein
MITPGTEPAIFWLAAQYLNQLLHRVLEQFNHLYKRKKLFPALFVSGSSCPSYKKKTTNVVLILRVKFYLLLAT